MSANGLLLLLSGPNLDLLGEREPDRLRARATLEDHVAAARAAAAEASATTSSTSSPTTRATSSRPSTPPGAGRSAIVINAGALTHTSWSLHDALAAYDGVVVELHLSNPAAREPFRHTSTIAPVADGCIAGFGGLGYPLAVEAAARCWPPARDPPTPRRPPSRLAPLSVAGRLDRVRAALAGIESDEGRRTALVVTTPANIRWLTGFTGSAGVLLVTGGRALLTTDGRYRTQAAEQLAGVRRRPPRSEVCIGGRRSPARGAGRGGRPRPRPSAWRPPTSRWAAARLVGRASSPPGCWCPPRGWSRRLRVVKDAGEIARMERAAAIADAALGVGPAAAGRRRDGRGEPLTESAFAAALDHAMRLLGAEDRAFETIVASGENSAKPHARPGSRVIAPGDPVVVDFGATFDGYRSDMTRTFCLGGAPTGELATVFEVVAAVPAPPGVAAVAPGVSAGDVDAVCRDLIAAAGWAERFEHGTGHGVGLDIHEGPSVGSGSTAILQPGTVVTVEPGVYLPDLGGVRIEDTLVVTDTGSRPLTRFPKEVAV